SLYVMVATCQMSWFLQLVSAVSRGEAPNLYPWLELKILWACGLGGRRSQAKATPVLNLLSKPWLSNWVAALSTQPCWGGQSCSGGVKPVRQHAAANCVNAGQRTAAECICVPSSSAG